MFNFTRYRNKMLLLLLALTVSAMAVPLSASAAGTGSTILLVLDGIKGESANAKYKDAIEILSMSFGASNPVSRQGAGGGQSGKPSYSEIALQKDFDLSSLPILEKLATGRSIRSGTLYFLRSDSADPYLTIELNDIFVTSESIGGSEGGGPTSESVSLNVGGMKFSYTSEGPKGTSGKTQTLDIDIAKGTATKS